MKNVCLAIIAMLLMVHLSCEAATAAQGACESCLNGEPTTLQVVIRDLSYVQSYGGCWYQYRLASSR